MWYEKWDFIEDPYGIKRTKSIPFDRITWNRDDLSDKENINRFLDAVFDHRSVSLRIFGPTRSGKTWLLVYLEKMLREKLGDNIVIINSEVPEAEPTIDSFYRRFIESLNTQIPSFLEKVEEKVGNNQQGWRDYFDDYELGSALYHIRFKGDQKIVSEQWLSGARLSASSLRPAGLITSLTKYKEVQIIIKLIDRIGSLYESCVLMVDEIGQIRPPSAARIIGGTLREILDSSYEKFGLVCTYTAVLSDYLMDLGYSQHFYKRFDYEVELAAIAEDYVDDFLTIHHSVYRKPDSSIENQLIPFMEGSLNKMLELMSFENYYPGPILHSCGVMASKAAREKVAEISPSFVEESKDRLPKSYLRQP